MFCESRLKDDGVLSFIMLGNEFDSRAAAETRVSVPECLSVEGRAVLISDLHSERVSISALILK